jgi:hypothetical protein
VNQVKAHKARLAFRTFEVVEQRSQDLWRPSKKRVGLRDPSFEALVGKALKTEFPKNRADRVASSLRKSKYMQQG